MKTLWQQIVDFFRDTINEMFDELMTPRTEDEKLKRKHPLTQDIPNKVERFTQRARRVLGLAQITAEQWNHSSIRPEHVLIALIREVDGMAGSMLKELKVDLKRAEALVETLSDTGPRKPGVNLELSVETKKLLELSVVEAREMGHYYIGTEHLLLGLMRQANTVMIQVLKDRGLTPADVRKHIHKALQEMRSHRQETATEDDNLEHFTPLSRQILTHARQEAERLQHQQLGTEHILLSLVLEPEGIAAQVLRDYQLDIHKVEALVVSLSEADTRKPDVPLVFSEAARKLQEMTVEEARQLKHPGIGPEHLLLAIGHYEGCTALRILRELGIDRDDLRTRTLKAIGE